MKILGFRVSDGKAVPLVIRPAGKSSEHVPPDVVVRPDPPGKPD